MRPILRNRKRIVSRRQFEISETHSVWSSAIVFDKEQLRSTCSQPIRLHNINVFDYLSIVCYSAIKGFRLLSGIIKR